VSLEPSVFQLGWQDAELFAVRHMTHLGFHRAAVTSGGPDNGVDVIAGGAIAQVKYQAAPVVSSIVQQVRGIGWKTEHVLMYAWSGYTGKALLAAGQLHVALFSVDSSSQVLPVSRRARAMTAWSAETRAELRQLRRPNIQLIAPKKQAKAKPSPHTPLRSRLESAQRRVANMQEQVAQSAMPRVYLDYVATSLSAARNSLTYCENKTLPDIQRRLELATLEHHLSAYDRCMVEWQQTWASPTKPPKLLRT
jgi:hypothetical protein